MTDASYDFHDVPVWWFRWHPAAKPGRWVVTFGTGFLPYNHAAVMDDFGTLVRVE